MVNGTCSCSSSALHEPHGILSFTLCFHLDLFVGALNSITDLSNHSRVPSLAVCNSLITFRTIFNMFCVWLLLSSMQHLSAKFRASFFLYEFGLCLTNPRWQSIYSAKLLLAVICKYQAGALSEKILYDNFPLFQESL